MKSVNCDWNPMINSMKNAFSKGTCEKMLVACQINVFGLDCTFSKRNLASYTSFES